MTERFSHRNFPHNINYYKKKIIKKKLTYIFLLLALPLISVSAENGDLPSVAGFLPIEDGKAFFDFRSAEGTEWI